MGFPTLSDQARQALEVIVGATAIDGASLMSRLGVSRPADMVVVIRELLKNDLVEVGGSITPDGVAFARVGVKPSSKEYASSYLKQA